MFLLILLFFASTLFPETIQNSAAIFADFNKSLQACLKDTNLNEYFLYSSRLKLQKGFVIEIIYETENSNAKPFVYIRKENEKPIENTSNAFMKRYPFERLSDLCAQIINADYKPERRPQKDSCYNIMYKIAENRELKIANEILSRIEIQQSPEGYFEFALFYLFHNRFWLKWHTLSQQLTYINDYRELEALAIKQKDIDSSYLSNLSKIKQTQADLRPSILTNSQNTIIEMTLVDNQFSVIRIKISIKSNHIVNVSNKFLLKGQDNIDY